MWENQQFSTMQFFSSNQISERITFTKVLWHKNSVISTCNIFRQIKLHISEGITFTKVLRHKNSVISRLCSPFFRKNSVKSMLRYRYIPYFHETNIFQVRVNFSFFHNAIFSPLLLLFSSF